MSLTQAPDDSRDVAALDIDNLHRRAMGDEELMG
jgi:hypothetical protein